MKPTLALFLLMAGCGKPLPATPPVGFHRVCEDHRFGYNQHETYCYDVPDKETK